MLNSKQVAVFDFREQAGKSSWSRTIIAVKTEDDVFAHKPFDLETHTTDGWQLIYSPAGFLDHGKLMSVPEIEEIA